jgi:hypothetical protein
MIERTADRFGVEPARLAADTGYGSAEMLGWLVEDRGIEPHIPVFDKSQRTDGTFSRDDFHYDHDSDVYFRPAGKMLTTKGTLVNDGATLLYRASTYAKGEFFNTIDPETTFGLSALGKEGLVALRRETSHIRVLSVAPRAAPNVQKAAGVRFRACKVAHLGSNAGWLWLACAQPRK